MIAFKDIKKSFGNKVVLDGLTFSIAAGEIYGLLGPNGAGKTTAINILCNLLDADAGHVMVEGNTVSDTTKYIVGIVPQETSVYKDLTCRENLMFFASIYGLQGPEKVERVDELIDIFDLDEYANTVAYKLSGGWQRRVNIAIALVHSPAFLVLDEPTTGLDIEARYELWQLIEHLSNTGVSILLTTHQLEEAESLCSRIGIIKDGQIKAEGSLDELRTIIAAKQLAILETDDHEMLRERATSFGWTYRHYGGRLTLWLPELFTLKAIVDKFDGLPLSSVSLKEVGLEHIYIEVTGS